MSCGSLSPATSVALAGMLKGEGLTVPPTVTATVNTFNSTGPVGAAQGAFTAATNVVGNPLNGLGSSTLPALTGVVPATLVTQLSDGSMNNFAGQITQQATRMMAGGIGGFSQIFFSAQGFVTSSINIKNSALNGVSVRFQNLGVGLTSLNGASGVISNGLGIKFSNLPNLGTVVGRLGSLYDTRNMQTFGQPDNMMKNLIAKGYGKSIGLEDKLEQAGVDLDDMSNPVYAANIRAVMSSIRGSELNTIMNEARVTGVTPTTLLDLTDVNNLGDASLINTLKPPQNYAGDPPPVVPTLNQIGRTFSDMGAQFEDSTKLAALVRTIETPVYPRLNAYHNLSGGTLTPSDTKTDLDQNTATGSIDNYSVKPTMKDMLGSISGAHVSSLSSSTTALTALNNDSDVAKFNTQMNLMRDVAKGVYFGGGNVLLDGNDPVKMGNVCVIPAGILSAADMTGVVLGNITQTLTNMRPYVETKISTISTKASIQPILNTLNNNYLNAAKQLALEKTNLKLAGMDPLSQMPGGPNSNSVGIRYDRSYPTAPVTGWSSDNLYRYWRSLPKVFTGNANVKATSDICRGAMYDSAKFFTNGTAFIANVNAYLASSESEMSANTWTRSVYPFLSNVTFDITSGICYFKQSNWRAENINDDRPVGYPPSGIPMPAGGTPSDATAKSSITSGDKNSIINLATQLQDIGKDPMGTGASAIIESMATDDKYGDAIKLAMAEGRNKERFISAGIVPVTNKIVSSTTSAASYTPPPSFTTAPGAGLVSSYVTPSSTVAAPAYVPSGMTVFLSINTAGARPSRTRVNIPATGTVMTIAVPDTWTGLLSAAWVPTIDDPAGQSAYYTSYILNSLNVMVADFGIAPSSGQAQFQSIAGQISWMPKLGPGNYTLVIRASRAATGTDPITSQIWFDFYS